MVQLDWMPRTQISIPCEFDDKFLPLKGAINQRVFCNQPPHTVVLIGYTQPEDVPGLQFHVSTGVEWCGETHHRLTWNHCRARTPDPDGRFWRRLVRKDGSLMFNQYFDEQLSEFSHLSPNIKLVAVDPSAGK